MRDEQLAQFVELLMTEDLTPSLGATPGLDVEHYISAVLARFRNPGIRHLLSQIAWDGSKKLPVRIVVTIAEALRANRPIHRLVMPIAAWMRFIVAAGEGRCRHRRSRRRADSRAWAPPAPERRARICRNSRYANRYCRRR